MKPIKPTQTFYQEYKVMLWVAVGGLAIYIIVLLSFLNVESKLKLHSNTALSEYATAIAGIVGTGVTVVGLSFLIYAYRAQQSQAREQETQALKQQEQSQFEVYSKLYENLLNDINSIQYRKKYKRFPSSSSDSEIFQGVEALFNYAADDGDNKSSVLNHLNLILISFKRILYLLEDKSNMIAHNQLLIEKIYLLFLSKIFWPCDKISTHYRPRLRTKHWGYPHTLFYHFDHLTCKAYTYLINNKIIVFPSPYDSLDIILNMDYSKGRIDILGPTVRSVLKCNYESIDTYWANEPLITDNYAYPSMLRNILLKLFGDSAYTDSIMERLDTGPPLVARKGLVWFKNKIKFLKPTRLSQSNNPRGCWEPGTN